MSPEAHEPIGTGELEDVLGVVVEQHEQLSVIVEEHTRALGVLDDRLTAFGGSAGDGEADEWNLRELDPADAILRWEALAEWVSWFNATYAPHDGNDLRIPECWYLHPHGRVVLLDLFYAWKAAQYGHSSPSSDAIHWDTVYLPAALRMAAEHNGWEKCRISKHQTERVKPARPVAVPVEFNDWLDRGDEATTAAPRTDQLPVVPPAPLSAQAREWEPTPWNPGVAR